MSYQKEFLQIPERQVVDATLKFATGLEKQGNFGPYFLYTVVHEGKEKFLKVTERLEKQFRKNNVQAKDVVSLLKETIQRKGGEPITLVNLLSSKPSQQEPVNNARSESHLAQEALRPPIPSSPEGFSGDTLTMCQSLQDALDITKTIQGVEWRNTDIEKIGVCLFLARTTPVALEKFFSQGMSPASVKKVRSPKKTNGNEGVPIPELVTEPEKDDLPF